MWEASLASTCDLHIFSKFDMFLETHHNCVTSLRTIMSAGAGKMKEKGSESLAYPKLLLDILSPKI